MQTATDVTKQTNKELLATLSGLPVPDVYADLPLTTLFNLRQPCTHPYGGLPAVAAAKELMARALVEGMTESDNLTSPGAVRDYLRLALSGLEHEVFVVLFLNAQNRLISCEEMFRGTLTQASVYPREVVKEALLRNAAAVIFAHNHPSGLTEPSRADEALTLHLKQSLALVDVKVLDHFIIAGNAQPLSFAERGLI